MRTEFANETVRLRRPRASDADALLAAIHESMAELTTWMSWCHPSYSRDAAMSWISSSKEGWMAQTEFNFLMTEPSTGELAGVIGLNQFSRANGFANLGYWVRSACTRRGLATAATRLVAQFGLVELGLTRVEVVVATGNHASQRVAEKAGATREGVLRNRLLIHNQPHDAFMNSFVAADFARG